MAKSIKIIFLKQDFSDKEGSLYIRTTEDRKNKRKSLGVKVREYDWNTYFNKKTQLFKVDKRFASADGINDIIKTKLKELSKYDDDLSYLPDEKKSFTKYWEKYIDTIENFGTKIKHEVVYSKLKKFLESRSKTGLLFIEITPSFVRELKLYLTKTKDPKILSTNSVNHYLKVIKSIINKARKEDEYIFSKDPFATIDFKKTIISKNVLSASDLTKLLKISILEKDMYNTCDMFAFQIFSNGMRISDLLLLRWNNFKNDRLNYKMFKTNYPISIPLNANTGTILHEILETNRSYDKLVANHKQEILNEDGSIQSFTIKEIEQELKKISAYELELSDEKKNEYNLQLSTHKIIKYKDYFFRDKNETRSIRLIDAKEALLKRVEEIYLSQVFSQITNIKKNNLNDFVFPLLDNEEFKDINENNDFSKMSLKQYKLLKHATIVYNRKLKTLQKELDIQVTLTSHVARHTFTNLLLLMEDVNLYDVSQSLGHSSLSITQSYIQSGFNTGKIDYINKTMSQSFKRK